MSDKKTYFLKEGAMGLYTEMSPDALERKIGERRFYQAWERNDQR